MSKVAPVGIKRLEGVHWYVRDLERSRKFYSDKLGFAETWRSTASLEKSGRQKSACFSAGNIDIVCSSPTDLAQDSRAARFLRSTPTASAR